jgi:hypothetical protein
VCAARLDRFYVVSSYVFKLGGGVTTSLACSSRTALRPNSKRMREEEHTPHKPMPLGPMALPKMVLNRPAASVEAPSSNNAYAEVQEEKEEDKKGAWACARAQMRCTYYYYGQGVVPELPPQQRQLPLQIVFNAPVHRVHISLVALQVFPIFCDD